MTDERWVTREEVADHLGVSVDTVDRLRERGLPSVRVVGRTRRFRLSEVDQWMREHGQETPA